MTAGIQGWHARLWKFANWWFIYTEIYCRRLCCCCSVAKWCPTLCNPMNCTTSGLSVPPHLPEFAQIHVHWVGDTIQLSHPLSPSSPSVMRHKWKSVALKSDRPESESGNKHFLAGMAASCTRLSRRQGFLCLVTLPSLECHPHALMCITQDSLPPHLCSKQYSKGMKGRISCPLKT